MLYLSGGLKELFHSNFLYWLGVNYRDSFQELMTKMCCINAPWPEGWKVRREYRHLDLCITYEKDTGKMRSGKPVVEECAFIIVENKVKSLPELTQLRRYEQAFINHDSGCTYVVLSLVKDFSGHKYLNENTCWQIHHYDELAQMIRDCCPDSIICQEHRPYIRDYCQYVSNLSMMAEEWRIDEHEPFLSQCDDLRELRLNDIYEKVRYAQVAMMLADKLRTVCQGDYLIDDRGKNGTSEFAGEWIKFGSEQFPDWESVLQYLLSKEKEQSLDDLLNEIGRTPLLTYEEELELLKAVQEKGTDSEEMRKLEKANMRIVVSVANQYQKQGLTLEELIEAGTEGLRKAAVKYDLNVDIKFIAYAVWWIRQSIIQALEEKKQ